MADALKNGAENVEEFGVEVVKVDTENVLLQSKVY